MASSEASVSTLNAATSAGRGPPEADMAANQANWQAEKGVHFELTAAAVFAADRQTDESTNGNTGDFTRLNLSLCAHVHCLTTDWYRKWKEQRPVAL